jgi:oligoendopeptidase F
MYDHPKATPAQLKAATVEISKRIWNRYYAPVLGGTDTPLLGIYSHMISYPLYLFNYPLGHLIAFQIEEQVNRAGAVGPEIERMAVQGAVAPDVWMTGATKSPVSAEPLLRATDAALGTPKR